MGIVAVVGSANLDISIRTYEQNILNDSNPGTITMHPGGVGRNIAENLARLNEDVHFFTQLGEEPNATYLRKRTEESGVTVHDLGGPDALGNRYAALFDQKNALTLGVGDTKGIETLEPEAFKEKDRSLIRNSDLLILETNLAPATLDLLANLNDRVIIDTVSTAKASRVMSVLPQIHTLSMNRLEAARLMKADAHASIDAIGAFFEKRGVKRILVTVGDEGAWLYEKGVARHRPPMEATLKSVSGAGDAFIAGYAYGLRNHQDPLIPAVACASIALEGDHAVSNTLSLETLRQRMEAS